MNVALLTAILGTCSSLVVALSSIYLSNRLISYKIDDLTTKVEKHNGLVERMYKVESDLNTICIKYDDLKETIDELKDKN